VTTEDLNFDAQRVLNDFGLLKAEDLQEGRLFDYFAAPQYFESLKSRRSCALIGGRGTGKTTVLRSLSYEGQRALEPDSLVSSWAYIGLYMKVDTNRVRAFSGGGKPSDEWTRWFGHYLNLSLVTLVVKFLHWFERDSGERLAIAPTVFRRVSVALHLPDATSLDTLAAALDSGLTGLEASLNNLRSVGADVRLSMSGQPVEILLEALGDSEQFRRKSFFFLIDEYENFSDEQQRVVNTLIKHRGANFAFKLGVRETGWRVRSTLDPDEHLTDPADYVRIDIDQQLEEPSAFASFAEQVCNSRLRRIPDAAGTSIRSIRDLLPGVSLEEEARILGVASRAQSIRKDYADEISGIKIDISDFDLFFVHEWARAHDLPLKAALQDYRENGTAWVGRIDNYKYAGLFLIRRGRRGIRKHYAGWDTFTQLAGRNIRYLLELVEQALARHYKDAGNLDSPVPIDLQTEAAQAVGLKNLAELQGNERHGRELTRIVLALGRIFGVMAAEPFGHAPEVTEFRVTGSDSSERVHDLLEAGVRWLAFQRNPGNKPGPVSDTKDFDYRLHPVFTAYFAYSHRKKRRLALTEGEFLGLADDHRVTIQSVLRRAGRDAPSSRDLPEQLRMFEQFFDAPA